MLNKQEILKNYEKEDKIFLSNIIDKLDRNINKNITEITSFLDVHEVSLVIPILNKFNIKYKVFDVQNLLERKVIVFLNEYEEIEYYKFQNIKCLKITPKTKDKLQHKDYMGTLYNLGININKFGDIFVLEDICYVFTFDTIYEYLKLNVEKIGNVKIEIDETDIENIKLDRIFDKKSLNLPSLRIDVVLAHLYKFSRNDIDKKIAKGQLFINSVKIMSKTKEIKQGDIISFRGSGKFKVEEFEKNKKDKYITKVLLYK